MVSRAHLSIGEVLVTAPSRVPGRHYLQDPFPREPGPRRPERTPSGYRKFYEADIDRLRWVLRQQRDAFLPLKVIKGRLEDQPDPEDEETEADAELAPDLEEQFEQGEVIVEASLVEVTSVEAAPKWLASADVGEPRKVRCRRAGRGPVKRPGSAAFRCRPAVWHPAEPGGPEDRPALHGGVPVGQRATTRSGGWRDRRTGTANDGRTATVGPQRQRCAQPREPAERCGTPWGPRGAVTGGRAAVAGSDGQSSPGEGRAWG